MNTTTAADAPYLELIARVFWLRKAAAYEASVLRVLTGYASIPTAVRRSADAQIERLTAAARGSAAEAYADIHDGSDFADKISSTATGEHAERAVAEVKALSRAIAHEGRIIGGYLKYKTFPKTRHSFNAGQAVRMYRVGDLGLDRDYSDIGTTSMRHALSSAGAPQTLTREEFEGEAL